MRSSRLPAVKTLVQFDFTFQPSIKREQVETLHGLGFLDRAENVILLGPPGVGKTHLAISLATTAADAGRRVYYGTLASLIDSLIEAGPRESCPGGCACSPIPRCSWSMESATSRSARTAPCSSFSSSTSKQGLRRMGTRPRRRGHGRSAHRPAAAPLPHRQHPGQQLPDAAASALAAVRVGRTT